MQTAVLVQKKATRPRADALRNRERIVTAAREMFVEFGSEVPIDEIARRAGVGNATVYRNFPDREALVREVVCSVMDRTAEAAELALAETGDAFEALERFVHVAADERLNALCPMMASTFDQRHPDLEAARERVEQLTEEIMDRAKAAGAPHRRGRGRRDDRRDPAQPPSGGHGLHEHGPLHPPPPAAVPGRSAGPGPLRTAGHGRDDGGPAPILTD